MILLTRSMIRHFILFFISVYKFDLEQQPLHSKNDTIDLASFKVVLFLHAEVITLYASRNLSWG